MRCPRHRMTVPKKWWLSSSWALKGRHRATPVEVAASLAPKEVASPASLVKTHRHDADSCDDAASEKMKRRRRIAAEVEISSLPLNEEEEWREEEVKWKKT